MEDPVTIESGRTYDREMITSFFEALKTVRDEEGNEVPPYCPINKIEVDPTVLIPNHALRREIEEFYARNPWSYEYDPR